GEVLKAAAPTGLTLSSEKYARIVHPDPQKILRELKSPATLQKKIITALATAGKLSASQLRKRFGLRGIHSALHALVARGWITLTEAMDTPQARPKYERVAHSTGNETAIPTGAVVTEKQKRLLDELRRLERAAGGPVPVNTILRSSIASSSVLNALAAKGFVAITNREILRTEMYGDIAPPPDLVLNPAQGEAVKRIRTTLDAGEYQTFLLHGVTGSGKTQIYIESIRTVREKGKSAIVLVPEISLTPQTVRRFKAHFGDSVAVMHSQMSPGERFDTWRLAHEGRISIVIGPRSAVFAPLSSIGLIVVDEEHEASYKQFDAVPRYNARDVAIVRASREKAVVILGSATPSAESFYNATSGKYILVNLPERVDNARHPRIAIVDMTAEKKRR
ncbi:MAG: primosomal protein N', partial [Bacteroidota bacterium]